MDTKSSAVKYDGDKFTIANSKKLGRYMVAAKNLSPGEVILREEPVVVGPVISEDPRIFCFACMRSLPDFTSGKSRYFCFKCKVAPLCGPLCETIGFHSTGECSIFQEKKSLLRDNFYELVRILLHLRVWLLKDDDPQLWSDLMDMEAHLNERRNTPVWQNCETTIVNVFKNVGLYKPIENDELLQKICGILDVNTFELRSPGSGPVVMKTKAALRGLYYKAAMMAHSCRGSANVSVDENFRMIVFAAVPLMTGDLITFNYTSSLVGTANRQEHLQVGKYFRCECRACKDPYEDGSYLSCLVCPRCRKDYVAMQKPLDPEPYGRKTKWQCRKCKRIFYGCLIKSTLEIANQLIDHVDESNQKDMEKLLDKLSISFHKNHYLILCLKQKILAVYRNEMTSVNPQKKTLQKMLTMEREILDVLEIVEPGISRLKGILLYEMHLPIAILANREYASREITVQELLCQLEESQRHLKRSLTMLLLEPINTPEGQLAKRAFQDLKALVRSVDDAKALLKDDACDKAQTRTTSKNRKKMITLL